MNQLSRFDLMASANKAFAAHLSGKPNEDYGNLIYDFLDSEKLIPYDNEEKNFMFEEAKDFVKDELMSNSNSLEARRTAKRLCAALDAGIWSTDYSSMITKSKIRAKKIALKYYFSELQRDGFETINFKR